MIPTANTRSFAWFTDDPLSALDPEVGKRMLEDCVVDLMRGKTRLLVTNQLQFLRYCDKIVALGSGKVVEQGTFPELMSRQDGEVKRIVDASSSGQNSTEKDQKKTEDSVVGEPAKQLGPRKSSIMAPRDTKALLTKEERNIGAVSWSVYKKYLQAGGGLVKFSIVFSAFILTSANSLATSTWITVWTSDSDYTRHSQGFYLGLYGMLAGKFERDSILSRLAGLFDDAASNLLFYHEQLPSVFSRSCGRCCWSGLAWKRRPSCTGIFLTQSFALPKASSTQLQLAASSRDFPKIFIRSTWS
jgi:hypothetical protein